MRSSGVQTNETRKCSSDVARAVGRTNQYLKDGKWNQIFEELAGIGRAVPFRPTMSYALFRCPAGSDDILPRK